ncbi:hypothetical protein [Aminivibrio sp.]|uniref:hypothetical protein n=1 Tax=Aminivibrio sp. TaxID=1872489 RepID=UPI001A59C7B1|nr:hypothetical protein [Aminivibrio sp.]MBL3540339.1 hypothetical protein [Aminivibrio sp.]
MKMFPSSPNPPSARLLPGGAEALRLLRSIGFMTLVAANQSGTAGGMFKEPALSGIQCRISELLPREGAFMDTFYHAPTAP